MTRVDYSFGSMNPKMLLDLHSASSEAIGQKFISEQTKIRTRAKKNWLSLKLYTLSRLLVIGHEMLSGTGLKPSGDGSNA